MDKWRKARSKKPTSYNENNLQRDIVNYLNSSADFGCKVSRIKNQGTYDPRRGVFLKNSMEIGIPDIIGCTKDGRAVYIEVKMDKSFLRPHQEEYLMEMKKRGAIVGVAYDLWDARDIMYDDPENYPRKDRTFGKKRVLAEGTKHEQKKKAEPYDPLAFLKHIADDNIGSSDEEF